MELDSTVVVTLRSVMASLRDTMHVCSVIPRRMTARLRSKMLAAGCEKQLEALDAAITLETSMEKSHSAAKATTSRTVPRETVPEEVAVFHASAVSSAVHAIEGPAGHVDTSRAKSVPNGYVKQVSLPSTDEAAGDTAADDPGTLAQQSQDHRRLIRQLVRDAKATPALLKILNDATTIQARQGLGSGQGTSDAGRPPAVLTAHDSKAVASRAGIPYVMAFLAAMDEVLEDRLGTSAEKLQHRRSDVNVTLNGVEKLKELLEVEEREYKQLVEQHEDQERAKARQLLSLKTKLGDFTEVAAMQEVELDVGTKQKRLEDEEAHEQQRAQLESGLAMATAELEVLRARAAKQEAVARIKRKRSILEMSKLATDSGHILLTLQRQADVLEAEIADGDEQIAALEAYIGAVQAERERKVAESSSWESKMNEIRRQKRLLENGSARLIARNLRMGWQHRKEMRRASSKGKGKGKGKP